MKELAILLVLVSCSSAGQQNSGYSYGPGVSGGYQQTGVSSSGGGYNYGVGQSGTTGHNSATGQNVKVYKVITQPNSLGHGQMKNYDKNAHVKIIKVLHEHAGATGGSMKHGSAGPTIDFINSLVKTYGTSGKIELRRVNRPSNSGGQMGGRSGSSGGGIFSRILSTLFGGFSNKGNSGGGQHSRGSSRSFSRNPRMKPSSRQNHGSGRSGGNIVGTYKIITQNAQSSGSHGGFTSYGPPAPSSGSTSHKSTVGGGLSGQALPSASAPQSFSSGWQSTAGGNTGWSQTGSGWNG